MKMSKRDFRVYLEDILSAILRIEKYTQAGRDFFLSDDKTQDAVLLQVSIIGEASSKLSPALKSKNPEIAWHDIIGMQNVIVHDYSGVKIETIWDTVKKDLPLLKEVVTRMLRAL